MAEFVDSVATLPTIQRYLTEHNAEGKSVHTRSPPQKYLVYPRVGGCARSYSVAVPADLKDNADTKAYLESGTPNSWNAPSIVADNGANLLIVDLLPGAQTTLHQTISIDFSIVLNGEIAHELDSGEIVTLKPGDHVVQRGTKHLWRNASETEPARLIAVTISIKPLEINGKILEETHEV